MIAPMSKWYNCDHYLYRLGCIRKVAILISVAHMSWVSPPTIFRFEAQYSDLKQLIHISCRSEYDLFIDGPNVTIQFVKHQHISGFEAINTHLL